ncbi:polysaccharide biosynthesis protein [Lignipirellula cremea]|uniref:UDP-N-acetyl-alpha-D-glucosamine C6 dehydratase n=1 Tax=Lignipirellula cremea TaxID=2528010 RepID=A0A518E3M8_9BACT|nr:nucleoside-diphosphate sugar epimerase/dehydratase [Lignipirellula cremea]QDU98705.1 UDP-N-acetyl-alpha-D-glucosamine C6 dehydratase [Lignipirellula cremea]
MVRIQSFHHLSPATRQVICAGVLAGVFAFIHLAAYWLRFDGLPDRDFIATSVLWAVAVKLLVFGRFHLFRGWSQVVNFHDLIALGGAASLSAGVLLLMQMFQAPAFNSPRSVLLTDWGFTIVLVGGLRSLLRFAEESRVKSQSKNHQTRVFILGANASGEALLRAVRRNPELSYRVEGFITHTPGSIGSRIDGVPVVGLLDDACSLAEASGVTELLITADELPGSQVRSLVERGPAHGVTVKVLPSYAQLLSGRVALKPRTVSIEDLLRRDPVDLDMTKLRRWIDDGVVMVTGSAGSIGSEICRQLLQFEPRKILLVDRWENGQFFLERELRSLKPTAELEVCMADVADGLRMASLFREHQPAIVIHAAAYKHVPLMEANPGEAVKNICLTTQLLADLANQNQVGSFVMISTDKAVNPTSTMGTCKRVAELYVQSLNQTSSCKFVTVRFGNVLGSNGSVVPIFREQIAAGGPLTVTHENMTRFFMTIPEASQLVLQAGAMGNGGEIFVLDMGEPVRIVDLARDMIRLSGLEAGEDIEIEFTGLRPGEKMYEELYIDDEKHLPTPHAKIMVAAGEPASLSATRAAIRRLADVSESGPEPILRELQQIVVQYHPPAKQNRAA